MYLSVMGWEVTSPLKCISYSKMASLLVWMGWNRRIKSQIPSFQIGYSRIGDSKIQNQQAYSFGGKKMWNVHSPFWNEVEWNPALSCYIHINSSQRFMPYLNVPSWEKKYYITSIILSCFLLLSLLPKKDVWLIGNVPILFHKPLSFTVI